MDEQLDEIVKNGRETCIVMSRYGLVSTRGSILYQMYLAPRRIEKHFNDSPVLAKTCAFRSEFAVHGLKTFYCAKQDNKDSMAVGCCYEPKRRAQVLNM